MNKSLEKGYVYKFFRDILGNGLFTVECKSVFFNKYSSSNTLTGGPVKICEHMHTDFLYRLEYLCEPFSSGSRFFLFFIVACKQNYKVWLPHKKLTIANFPYRSSFFSLVSTWKSRRRLLNPTFNPLFLKDILLDIFNVQNNKLKDTLAAKAGTGEHFDLWPLAIENSIKIFTRK